MRAVGELRLLMVQLLTTEDSVSMASAIHGRSLNEQGWSLNEEAHVKMGRKGLQVIAKLRFLMAHLATDYSVSIVGAG